MIRPRIGALEDREIRPNACVLCKARKPWAKFPITRYGRRNVSGMCLACVAQKQRERRLARAYKPSEAASMVPAGPFMQWLDRLHRFNRWEDLDVVLRISTFRVREAFEAGEDISADTVDRALTNYDGDLMLRDLYPELYAEVAA